MSEKMTSSSLDFIRGRQIQQTMLMLQFVLDFILFFYLLGLMTVLTDSMAPLFCHCNYFTSKSTPRSCWAAKNFHSITKTKQTRSHLHVKICFFFIIIHRPWLLLETKSGRIVFMLQRFAKATQIRIKTHIRARQAVCPPRQQMFTHSIN